MAEPVHEASGRWRPAGVCSLFLCDIASFGSASRTDLARTRARQALYDGLHAGFDGGGVPFDACYREDRGDGVMIVVPPHHETAVLVTSVVDRFRAEVRRHNEVSSEAARLQVRIAVHTGECYADDHGLVSSALNHAFRILDAAPIKESLRVSGAAVALAVSQRVYEDVIMHGRGLVDPTEYRRIRVGVKETSTHAWIRVPGERPAVARESAPVPGASDIALRVDPLPPRPVGGTGQVMWAVVDRMLEIPLMLTERGREQVLAGLPVEIAGVIPRSPDARSDTYAIIRTCLDYPGGLHQLIETMRGFVGGSMALNRLQQEINHLLLED